MSAKNDLQHSLIQLLKYNREGSYASQSDRRKILKHIASEISAGGYKIRHIKGLKQKHVRYLNDHWKESGLSVGTIKNRNATLRWLCHKMNKRDLMPSNASLKTGSRVHVAQTNKAISLTAEQLGKITSYRVIVQLKLQEHLGLRREEAIKIQPHVADKGSHIELQASWCKGGRPRIVPVDSPEARYWLNEAKKVAHRRGESMAGFATSYKAAKELYNKQVQRAGIKNPHGLRHAYAQKQFKEQLGIEAPINGGPQKSKFSESDKEEIHKARMKISEALGHSRLNITSTYLGSNR